MTMTEVWAVLLRVNVALAAAVALVLVSRLPARRLFGARVAYGLWALVPLAAAAMLVPARVVVLTVPVSPVVELAAGAPAAAGHGVLAPANFDPGALLPWAWALGALASATWLGWRQLQFSRALRLGRAGPAAVGVLRPRVVTPDDFATRYSPREQQVILAHERTHIRRHDPRMNAVVALGRCLAWFNPMAHLAGLFMRIDQELACDAEVVAAHPTARRAYAEAMLKTQLAAQPIPFGCHWLGAGPHPLAARIALLAHPAPTSRRRMAGAFAIGLIALGAAAMAWIERPPEVRWLAAVVGPPAHKPSASVQDLEPFQARTASPGALHAPVHAPSVEPQAATPAAPPAPTAAEEAPPPTLAPTDAAPAYRIRGASQRSHVEPGSAVRIFASMIDPEGHRLVTDLTAYGSQSDYRTGYFTRDGSRYSLFTAVAQEGDVLRVAASLSGRFAPGATRTIALRSGETGTMAFEDGQTVTVTAALRKETPDEVEDARRWRDERYRRPMILKTVFDRDLFHCGHRGAVC
jgi:beta-lactamase regulating signal transducer with metallopeptidase domain